MIECCINGQIKVNKNWFIHLNFLYNRKIHSFLFNKYPSIDFYLIQFLFSSGNAEEFANICVNLAKFASSNLCFDFIGQWVIANTKAGNSKSFREEMAHHRVSPIQHRSNLIAGFPSSLRFVRKDSLKKWNNSNVSNWIHNNLVECLEGRACQILWGGIHNLVLHSIGRFVQFPQCRDDPILAGEFLQFLGQFGISQWWICGYFEELFGLLGTAQFLCEFNEWIILELLLKLAQNHWGKWNGHHQNWE